MSEVPKVKLLNALREARTKMKAVTKSGENTFDRYEYATLEDYIQSVEEPLASHGLYLMTNVEEVEQLETRKTKNGGLENAVRVKLQCTIFHCDSGESITATGFGEGQDRADKAIYKATTGARKYAIASLFNLCTSDDPEGDETVGHTVGDLNGSERATQQQPKRSVAAGKPSDATKASPPVDIDSEVMGLLATHGQSPEALLNLLNRLASTPNDDWGKGSARFAKLVSTAGSETEKLIQRGAWSPEACEHLNQRIDGLKKHIANPEDKGLF